MSQPLPFLFKTCIEGYTRAVPFVQEMEVALGRGRHLSTTKEKTMTRYEEMQEENDRTSTAATKLLAWIIVAGGVVLSAYLFFF